MDRPTQSPFASAQSASSTGRLVEAAFTRFLDQEINISRAARSQASTSQNHLRDFLVGEATRDDAFPRILQYADTNFLGGSFARHSKIRPLDDIDIYFPIDGAQLVYCRNGWRLPYTVLSDGVLDANPLLDGSGRWTNGSSISSRKLVDGFAKVLNRHYPAQTKVRRVGEAVNVQMAELGFDIVPCFSLRPDTEIEAPFYVIPDGADGWIHTNPLIDNAVSAQLHQANNRTFRKSVKLVKWWNTNRFDGRLASYYVELAVMRGFSAKNQWGEYATSLPDAVALGFESLRDAVQSGDLHSWLASAPPVERGAMTSDDSDLVDLVASVAREAVTAEARGDVEGARKTWKLIFGPKFPE